MLPRRPVIVGAICAIAGAAAAVRFLEPRVDRLAMALGIGIAAGPATAESEQLLTDWYRLVEPTNVVTAVAFWLIAFGGLPLSVLALVAKYCPRLVSPLVRNRTAVWVCLTWQLTNVGFPVLLTLLLAFEMPAAETAVVVLVSLVYVTVNLLAARVWRELLVRITATPTSSRLRPAV